MSGIDGYYHSDDWGWEYYPGKIFSQQYGPNGGRRPNEAMERRHWQNVSSCLQHNKKLAPYQARLKIYELEKKVHDKGIKKDFLKESPNNIVRIIYGECD